LPRRQWWNITIDTDRRPELRAFKSQHSAQQSLTCEKGNIMPRGYWFSFYRAITNFDALDAYAELAVPAIAAAGGRVLVRGVAERVYEAGLERRVAVIEFESLRQAIAAHESSRYQAALKRLGTGAVERDTRIIEESREERFPNIEPRQDDRGGKGYWIAFYRSVSKPDALDEYAKLAIPALRSSGGRYLASGVPAAVYEAGLHERVAMIEFDNVQQAIAAHDSPGYQAALRTLGTDAVERDVRIVEQVREWA
jgi:uncharacterized protein (DUF1330 family)